jgi:hypothetical protein
MRLLKGTLALLASVWLVLPLSGAAADHRHHAAAAGLELDHGRKWETDAPLRRGMAELRKVLMPRLDAIHRGSLSREDHAQLGAAIEAQVGMIVSQCKLAPKADAMLHIVIAELIGAADVLQGKAAGDASQAARRAVAAVDDYGRYFAHPGWQGLK